MNVLKNGKFLQFFFVLLEKYKFFEVDLHILPNRFHCHGFHLTLIPRSTIFCYITVLLRTGIQKDTLHSKVNIKMYNKCNCN